ncbi:MAG TPA: cytochrome c [Desulfuromonadales bacterium]|nr:cytochrome c [Desulfuromonadales bacterium]
MEKRINLCMKLLLAATIVASAYTVLWNVRSVNALTGTAASGFSVTVNSSGPTTALNLSATINAGTGDVGTFGNTYVFLNYLDLWFLHNGVSWVKFDGKTIPVYSSGTLPARTNISFLTGQDVSGLAGLNFYAGYGDNAQEMLASSRLKQFYTIPAISSVPDGVALYNANCAGCHRVMSASSARGKSASQIQSAIASNRGGMKSLSFLSSAEIQAIAAALF